MGRNRSFNVLKLSFYKIIVSGSTFSFKLKILFILLLMTISMQGQDCSLNAGVSETICENNFDFSLSGSLSGANLNGSIWKQISGNPVIIVDPKDLNTKITGIVGGNSYVFRLSAFCNDGGLQFQDVTITVNAITTANTGADIFSCPDTTGTLQITGNTPQNLGDSGSWSFIGNNNAGVVINSPNSANSTINLLETYAGLSILRWTIKSAPNSSGQSCESYADISITNYGGRTQITAGEDQFLDNCYSVFQRTRLNASFGGNNINNQQGTWSLVTGPSSPVFDDVKNEKAKISNLIEGTYVLKWTVNGPCTTGTDTVNIVVDTASQDISKATVQYSAINLCDANVETLTLIGSPSEYVGETMLWEQTFGPGISETGVPAIISNPISSTTQVSNLDGASTYVFTYTIANNNTNCSDSNTVTVSYSIDPISVIVNDGEDVNPNCGVKRVDIPFEHSGDAKTSYSIVDGPVQSGLVDPATFINITDSPLSLTFDKIGDYTILFRRAVGGSFNTGCTEATDVVNVKISAMPTLANAGTGQNLKCNASETSLTGNVPAIGTSLWSQIEGPNSAEIDDPYARTTLIKNLVPGLYTFRYSISGGPNCFPEAFSDVVISVPTSSTTNANAGIDKVVCFGTNIPLDAAAPDESNLIGTWSIVSVPSGSTIIFEDVNNPKTNVSGLDDAGENYTFKWTVSNPSNAICPFPSEDTVTITTNSVLGSNAANAGQDQCLPSGTNLISLAANSPSIDETGTWTSIPTNGINFTDRNLFNTTATISIEQSYLLTWTLDKCNSSSDEVEISVGNPIAYAGPDQNVCSSNVQMNAGISGGTGLWTLISGPGGYSIVEETNSKTAINFTFSGQYEFEWTVSNGNCFMEKDQVLITVGIPGTVAMVTDQSPVCNSSTVTLLGNEYDQSVESGVWTVLSGAPNTPLFENVNDPNSLVSGLVSGIYDFRWTINGSNTCGSTFADTSVIVNIPADAGHDQYLCETTNLLLEATFGSTGTWQQIDGPGVNGNPGTAALINQNPPNGNRADVIVTLDNTYVFEFSTDYISCESTSDDVVVTTRNGSAVLPNAGVDQTLCFTGLNNSITLAGNDPITAGFDITSSLNQAYWSFTSAPFGSVATINDINSFNSQLENLNVPGIYVLSWNFTIDNCVTKSDEMRIEVFRPLEANAGPDQVSACQLNAQLNAIEPTLGIGEWTIVSDPSNGDLVIENPNLHNTSLSNITAIGTYIIQWTVSNGAFTNGGCEPVFDVVEITFPEAVPDLPDAGSEQQLCSVSQTTLDASPVNQGIGVWSQTSGPGISVSGNESIIVSKNNPTTIIENLEPGVYEFTWTITSSGCSLNDQVIVEVFDGSITSFAGADQELNEFEILQLDANSTMVGVGQWIQVSGPTTVNFVDQNNPKTAVLGTTFGNYIFEWSVTNGPCNVVADQVEITFTGSSDLELTKSVFPIEVNIGDTVTFTLNIFNNNLNGSGEATGVSVKDVLPEGYVFIANSISDNGLYDAATRSLIWSNLTISNGSALDLTFQASITKTESYLNTAEIIASDQPDRDSDTNNHIDIEDDQDSATIILIKSDLELYKTVSEFDVNLGDKVTFSITVFNNPSKAIGDATGITVTDYVPNGYQIDTETISGNGFFDINTNTISWSNFSLLNGSSLDFTYDATIISGDSYFNVVEVSKMDQLDPDSTPNNDTGNQNEDDESNASVIPQTTDLNIKKVVNNTSPAGGEIIFFTITVSNEGEYDATNIGIDEVIPTGYDFVNSEVSDGFYDESTGFWSIPALTTSNTATLILSVEVLITGDYLNTASLAYLDQIDLNISNDSAQATVAPVCVKVYNQFSPNDDGVNDVLIIDCLGGYPNNFLKVFDRNGSIVYETSSYISDWNGIANKKSKVPAGVRLPVGTYFYSLDLGNDAKPLTGWLYIKI
jgi:gliding motility-associated-like protein/uncharacterized repeat protein (TIGR01451 family)